MKNIVLAASLTAALASAGFAQNPSDTPPEKAAVIANDRAYEAAYAKADVKALAAFFSEDAEYTSDEGQIFRGRAEIEDAIRSAFAGNKGAKLAIEVDTVRA